MKASCIQHPPGSFFVRIWDWQVEACEGNHCAAALLGLFEYFHNILLEQQSQAMKAVQVAEMHGDTLPPSTALLQWHSEADLERRLVYLYGRTKINQAITLLVEKGWLSLHSNPNPRYHFDRTRYFLFHPDAVMAYLEARTKVTDASLISEGPSTISEGPSTISEGPSTISEGPSTISEGPSTISEGSLKRSILEDLPRDLKRGLKRARAENLPACASAEKGGKDEDENVMREQGNAVPLLSAPAFAHTETPLPGADGQRRADDPFVRLLLAFPKEVYLGQAVAPGAEYCPWCDRLGFVDLWHAESLPDRPTRTLCPHDGEALRRLCLAQGYQMRPRPKEP